MNNNQTYNPTARLFLMLAGAMLTIGFFISWVPLAGISGLDLAQQSQIPFGHRIALGAVPLIGALTFVAGLTARRGLRRIVFVLLGALVVYAVGLGAYALFTVGGPGLISVVLGTLGGIITVVVERTAR